MERSEEAVAADLLDAQSKAQALFSEIEARELIRPGTAESEISQDGMSKACEVLADALRIGLDELKIRLTVTLVTASCRFCA
jgi:hypothetical protein